MQLARDSRRRRVGQVQREQRIDLPERDHESFVAHEAGGENPLAGSDANQAADDRKVHAALAEHINGVLRLHAPALGRGDAEVAVVLVHRELIQKLPRHRSDGGQVYGPAGRRN